MKVSQMQLTPAAFYDLVLQPNFMDITPEFSGSIAGGWLSEFTVMPNVHLGLGQNIIDVIRKGNILQRKGRTCKTNWVTLGDTQNRKIFVAELEGAVQNCQEEFYDGCWKDFRDQAPKFQEMAVQFFKQAIGLDIYSNAYFGDVTKADDATGKWSWNKFDGIVTKIQQYITNAGPNTPILVPTALPSGDMSPTQAYTFLKALKDNMTDLMNASADMDLAIYINYGWAKQYMRYLIGTGNGSVKGADYIQNGIPVMDFEGIPIYVEKLWDPILRAKNAGVAAHMGILTLRNNFVFATNKAYGGGPMLNQALRVWYDDVDDIWKYKANMCAGTEIMSPSNLVFSITSIA